MTWTLVVTLEWIFFCEFINEGLRDPILLCQLFVCTAKLVTETVFSARQHICYSALYAIARPSVRLSVPLSVTRVDQSKTVKVRITQPSPQSSPMTLVS